MSEDEIAMIARQFHDTYEELAPSFGYETRPETRAFDPTSPNGRLMTAVVERVVGEREREVSELVALVKRLMTAIECVPMRPIDCDQGEVYELMDRIAVILDVPGATV